MCCAELQRLRGVFLATLGADEAQIEASFNAAISIANEQKSASLARRAEATYAEYRRRKQESLKEDGGLLSPQVFEDEDEPSISEFRLTTGGVK